LTVTLGIASPPKVGEPAPELKLDRLLQAPAGASTTWEALKGKVVVLEFWTTWCGPCVAAIPHLNELAEKLADQPVQFIAITDEKAKVVEPFLKKKRIKAWVALDADRATFQAYGLRGIPRTILIDREGVIVAMIQPTELTEQVLRDMLAGKKPSLPMRSVGDAPTVNLDSPPLFQVVIREAPDTGVGRVSRGPGSLTLSGHGVRFLLAMAYDMEVTRLLADAPLPEGSYDAIISVPHEKQPAMNRLFREALKTTFGLRVEREQREMDAYVMIVSEGGAAKLEPTVTKGRSTRFGDGKFTATSVDLDFFASMLEQKLGRPVVNETNSAGRFDIELAWTADDPKSIIAAVEEQLGLRLVAEQRSVEVGVIRAAKPKD
jgi:uncharacterized protein (TIGR03435 family)